MHFTKIKIGRILLIMLALFLLGFTHFLGGPYGLAKFFFLFFAIGGILFIFVMWRILSFANKLTKGAEKMGVKIEETIKVESTIVEE